jgi:CRISPR-associated endoribonuclease Cas6
MRVRVSLEGTGQIPFNYNLALAGAVYGSIKRVDLDLAYSIHSSTEYKLFTFSWLRIPNRRISNNGIHVDGNAHFFVSSPIRRIITSFVEGLFQEPYVKIDHACFEVDTIKILKLPKFNGKMVFSTLSPIIVRTAKKENDKLRIIDLYPTNQEFYENLKSNLIKKYRKLYDAGKEDISFLRPSSTKPVRIKIKNTFHRASHMVFEASGDSELLQLGYEAGFGEKNSMGFGMVRTVKKA